MVRQQCSLALEKGGALTRETWIGYHEAVIYKRYGKRTNE